MKLTLVPLLALLCLTMTVRTAATLNREDKIPSDDWDEQTDFTAERYKFARTKGYSPYAIQMLEKIQIAEAMKQWKTGSKAEALEMLRKVAATNIVGIEAYRRLADGMKIFAESATDPGQKATLEQFEHHYRVICDGLVKSIVVSGDGKTESTAFQVISIQEEHWVMRFLGLVPQQQSLDDKGGPPLDIWTFKRKDGSEGTAYFNIERFFGTPKIAQ